MVTKVNGATIVALLSILALIVVYVLGLGKEINNPLIYAILVIVFAGVGCNTWERSNKKRLALFIAALCITIALVYLKMFFGFEV